MGNKMSPTTTDKARYGTNAQTITTLEIAEEMKSVYIVENEFGNIKIGVSKNATGRISVLSKQGGFRIARLFMTEGCSNAFKLEKKCHKHFKDNRINGEWFEIDFLIAKKYLQKIFDIESKSEVIYKKMIMPEGIDFLFNRTKENHFSKFSEETNSTMEMAGITDSQRFHEMEQGLNDNISEVSLGELASYLKIMDKVANRQNLAPHKIAENFKKISARFGIELTEDFVKVPEYHQIKLEEC